MRAVAFKRLPRHCRRVQRRSEETFGRNLLSLRDTRTRTCSRRDIIPNNITLYSHKCMQIAQRFRHKFKLKTLMYKELLMNSARGREIRRVFFFHPRAKSTISFIHETDLDLLRFLRFERRRKRKKSNCLPQTIMARNT